MTEECQEIPRKGGQCEESYSGRGRKGSISCKGTEAPLNGTGNEEGKDLQGGTRMTTEIKAGFSKGGVFIFVFFLVSFLDLFLFFVASGFWLLWLLAFVAFGFCGFWLLWLLAFVAFVASVAFGFCGFWLFGLSIYLSIPIYLSIYLSIFLSFFWQLFSFLFLYLLFLLFSLQRRNQTRKQASKQASTSCSPLDLVCCWGGRCAPPHPPPAPRNLHFIPDTRACHEINILR